MGHHTVIMIFGILSFMGCYAATISNRKLIKEIGFHKKYYPKRYIMPGRRFRKLFGLRKSEIPKWLYLEFYMSFVYIALFVAFILLYLLLDNKLLVAETFFWIYGILLGVDTFHILVCWLLYK